MKPTIKILARQNALTEEEWQKLFEARLEMIKPHLRDMTLKSIGDLAIVKDYFGDHALKRDNPDIDRFDCFDLETRGFFPSHVTSTEYLQREDSGYTTAYILKMWGFTRNNEWIIIEVYITTSLEPYKYPGRTERVARARRVTIRKSSFDKIRVFSQKTHQYFWEQLGILIKDWACSRKHFYEIAHRLELQVEHEEKLLEYVPQK